MSDIPGPRSPSAPTPLCPSMLYLMPISSFLCPRRAGWPEQALRRSARYVGAALGSGVCGTWPSTQLRPPSAHALPSWVSQLCPELKSLGALRVNNRAVPSSPCTGWRPSQGGWYQGSPCPRQCCSVMSLREGHRLVPSLSKGGTGQLWQEVLMAQPFPWRPPLPSNHTGY